MLRMSQQLRGQPKTAEMNGNQQNEKKQQSFGYTLSKGKYW